VTMPSRYSSAGSVDDSLQLAQNLGMELLHFPIEDVLAAYLQLFEETFCGLEAGITEENLQARIRGNIVMALSNKFGWLALTTGNKSEVSVGYCTIYGDMAGGFAPLKDVTKNMVYRLAKYRNKIAGYDLIPRAIIEKAPSAELRPNQKDQDSLPPYDELDQILERYIEHSEGIQEIIAAGFNDETVRKVARLVDFSEYKRRQAAPGVKITPLAFGKDRRMPITNHYRGI
jgi:NAD+ synthase (glutamine-hydrolysing)